MSESETRSVVAIGNSRVIPAKAGIQILTAEVTRLQLDAGLRRGDDICVIPASSGIHV